MTAQGYPRVSVRRWVVAGLVAVAATVSAISHAAPLTAEQALIAVGISSKDVPRLLKGEILSYSVTEPTHKSLANGIAMYMKVPPEHLVDVIKRKELLARDPEAIAYGAISPGSEAKAFAKFAFSPSQAKEAKDLLNAEAGSEFNLSKEELVRLQSLRQQVNPNDRKAVIAAASKYYREVLHTRLQEYQRSGLSGIAPYARGDGAVSDPATELRLDSNDSQILSRYFPELRKALLSYPAGMPPEIISEFLWVNRKVQDRPTPTLSHRLIYSFDGGAVLVQREFYVAHNYNSSQLEAGSLPFEDGSLVFYTHRSSTDQVSGLARALRHSIGRERLKDTMVKRFQRVKASVR